MRHLILLLFLCFVRFSAWAQPAYVMKSNASYLNMTGGLPSNFVDDIYADSYGFMWIATHGGGLVRYDGYAYRYFGVGNDGMSLRSNTCHNIVEDKFHRLWISFDEYTEVLDLKTMKTVAPDSRNDALRGILNQLSVKVYRDSKEALWIVNRSFIYHVTLDHEGKAARILQIGYHGNTPDIALADVERNGSVWVAIDGGLYKLAIEHGRLVKHVINPAFSHMKENFITSLKVVRGDVWIGSSQGLLRYNLTQKTLRKYHHSMAVGSLSHDYVSSLAVSAEGQLLVGTLGGVDFYQPTTDDFLHWNAGSKTNPLSSNFVNCLFVYHGFTWVGTETGGITKLNPRPLQLENFSHTDAVTSLSPNAVNAMYAETDGTLWVGTVEGGLNRKAKGSNVFTHFTTTNSALTHNAVSTLAADGDKRLWIGTWGGGLHLIDMRSHATIQKLSLPENYARLTQFVGALCYDQRNQLMWIGSNDGIYAYDLRRKEIFEPFKGCGNIRGAIGSIIDNTGCLWMGCVSGVVKIDLKSNRKSPHLFSYTHFSTKLDNPKSGIIDKLCTFCQSRDGTLWLGSNGYGLYKRMTDRNGKIVFKAYTQRDGLANNAVKGIVEDRNGMLWITTDNGLSQFNPHTEAFTNYTVSDGLLSSQFYWNSAVSGADGTLYFGSDKGVTVLHGDNSASLYHGRLRFTRLIVNNEDAVVGTSVLDNDISQAKRIRVSEADKSIMFEFSSLSYSNETQGVYSCRMKGFEDDWIQLKPGEHSMRYTHLPPGDYEFQVKYVSALSKGNDMMASVAVSVAPYFWKSWWFELLLLVIVGFMARYFYKRRVRELRRKEAERLMQPIEDALRESEEPSELQHRIEEILHVQQKVRQSKQRSFLTDQTEMDGKEKPFMDQVMAVVEQKYMDSEFGVAELAEALGMNRSMLSRRLNVETGFSTSQFLRNYRLDVAKKILVNNPHDRNITEIAYKVGFNDPKYFTRCYSKRFGEAPKRSLSNDASSKGKESEPACEQQQSAH